MRLYHFTDHTLPIMANWSQFLSGITLLTGLIHLYTRHTCAMRWCFRPVFRDDEDGIPLCRKHLPTVHHQPKIPLP